MPLGYQSLQESMQVTFVQPIRRFFSCYKIKVRAK